MQTSGQTGTVAGIGGERGQKSTAVTEPEEPGSLLGRRTASTHVPERRGSSVCSTNYPKNPKTSKDYYRRKNALTANNEIIIYSVRLTCKFGMFKLNVVLHRANECILVSSYSSEWGPTTCSTTYVPCMKIADLRRIRIRTRTVPCIWTLFKPLS